MLEIQPQQQSQRSHPHLHPVSGPYLKHRTGSRCNGCYEFAGDMSNPGEEPKQMGSHWLGPMSLTGSTNYTGMSLDDHTIDATPHVPQGNAPPPDSALVTWYENAAHEATSPAGAGPSNGVAVRPSHACTMHSPPASVAYVHFSLFHRAACMFGHEACVILICRYSPLTLSSRSLAVRAHVRRCQRQQPANGRRLIIAPAPGSGTSTASRSHSALCSHLLLTARSCRSRVTTLGACGYETAFVGMKQGQVSLRPFTCTAYNATEAFRRLRVHRHLQFERQHMGGHALTLLPALL